MYSLRYLLLSASLFLSAIAFSAEQYQIPEVVVAPAKLINQMAPKRYVGYIESIESVKIMPRVTGELRKIHFKEGDMVQQGDLLYEIEDTTYQAAVDRLKAQQKVIEASLKYAEIEFKRSSNLLANKAISISAHDQAEMQINTAKAQLLDIKAALRDAENNLSYTKIYAPITGRIGKSQLTVGNLIVPNGQALTDIEKMSPLYVRFSISERTLLEDYQSYQSLSQKAIVQMQLADDSILDEKASIELIDNKINPTSNTLKLWASFSNKKGRLLPGSFVTVLLSIKTEKPCAGIIPSALIAEQTGYYVYILNEDDSIEKRSVKIGNYTNGYQIITEGLEGNEIILIDGTHKVQPGMKVKPIPFENLK